MATMKVSSKGQITLPVSVRRIMGIKPGDKVDLAAVGNRAILTKARKGDFVGYAKSLRVVAGPLLTDREADLLVAEQVTAHYDRKRREGKV